MTPELDGGTEIPDAGSRQSGIALAVTAAALPGVKLSLVTA
jgi:hypothetical protein